MFCEKKTDSPIFHVYPFEDTVYLNNNSGGESKKSMNCFNSVELPKNTDVTLVPKNKPDQRDVVLISGRSGSGKSYWCRLYAINYMKMFPKRKIYIFSAVQKDKAFDDLSRVERIVLDDNFLALEEENEDGFDFNIFKNCLVIFDDTEKIGNKKILTLVNKIRDQLLEMGRHNKVHMLYTTHMCCNYKSSRILLNECNYIILFNVRTNNISQYYLKTYSGLSKDKIKEVSAINSRFIGLHLEEPSFYFYENGFSAV